jgi:hypothetical protein
MLFGDPTLRVCVASCPARALLFSDTTTNLCVPVCPASYYGIQANMTCATSCPASYYTSDVNRMCVTRCPNPYYSYQPNLTCIVRCPDSYYPSFAYSECRLCPATCSTCLAEANCDVCKPSFYLFQGACVADCPTSPLFTYRRLADLSCVASAGCRPLYGKNSSQNCEASCSTG